MVSRTSSKLMYHYVGKLRNLLTLRNFSEMLAELSRREKEANIKPDPDLDIYMKVKILMIMLKNKLPS